MTLELGTLKNGLGSIQNLELLLKSIRIGQKGLFAAVAAVHADCAPMVASARELLEPLARVSGDTKCAGRLTTVFADTLTSLETVLEGAVRSGRLSVGQRLRLEGELARAGRELCAGLRLVSLLERAARPRPAEATPIELVHAGGTDRPDAKSVEASVVLSDGGAGSGLGVDLDAAKLLVELAVALVIEGQSERTVRVTFTSPAGGNPVTRVTLGAAQGARVKLGLLGLLGPSLSCGEAASRSLGGRFEYSPEAHRACIYWPLS